MRKPNEPAEVLPAAAVLARYEVSEVTLYRWVRDKSLGFPSPFVINGRRYWHLEDLRAFEQTRRFD